MAHWTWAGAEFDEIDKRCSSFGLAITTPFPFLYSINILFSPSTTQCYCKQNLSKICYWSAIKQKLFPEFKSSISLTYCFIHPIFYFSFVKESSRALIYILASRHYLLVDFSNMVYELVLGVALYKIPHISMRICWISFKQKQNTQKPLCPTFPSICCPFTELSVFVASNSFFTNHL